MPPPDLPALVRANPTATISRLATFAGVSRLWMRELLRRAGLYDGVCQISPARGGRGLGARPWVESPGLSAVALEYLAEAERAHDAGGSRQSLYLARRFVSGICARCPLPRRADSYECGSHRRRKNRPPADKLP